jgi:hypothetical protein
MFYRLAKRSLRPVACKSEHEWREWALRVPRNGLDYPGKKKWYKFALGRVITVADTVVWDMRVITNFAGDEYPLLWVTRVYDGCVGGIACEWRSPTADRALIAHAECVDWCIRHQKGLGDEWPPVERGSTRDVLLQAR